MKGFEFFASVMSELVAIVHSRLPTSLNLVNRDKAKFYFTVWNVICVALGQLMERTHEQFKEEAP